MLVASAVGAAEDEDEDDGFEYDENGWRIHPEDKVEADTDNDRLGSSAVEEEEPDTDALTRTDP